MPNGETVPTSSAEIDEALSTYCDGDFPLETASIAQAAVAVAEMQNFVKSLEI